ncbi:hypothetical protein TNCT_331241 [Trichonephila clavata]|uniref:Uncharacterized protein n=1 Tax=Trichonephila clavata TaxID=2740835 RepID=A0A8X6F1K5_TRICU|nr:hypothetical protein TNCT_331241 [Trichonephila clavata]
MYETENFLQIIDSCVRVCGWRYLNRSNNQWVIIRGMITPAVATNAPSEGVGMWWCLRDDFIKIAVPPDGCVGGLQELLSDVAVPVRNCMRLQHKGAPSHYGRYVSN